MSYVTKPLQAIYIQYINFSKPFNLMTCSTFAMHISKFCCLFNTFQVFEFVDLFYFPLRRLHQLYPSCCNCMPLIYTYVHRYVCFLMYICTRRNVFYLSFAIRTSDFLVRFIYIIFCIVLQ